VVLIDQARNEKGQGEHHFPLALVNREPLQGTRIMKQTTTNNIATEDRTLCILQPIQADGRGTIRITERISRNKVEVKTYQLTTFPAYGGEAVGITFEQEQGEPYSTCINGKKSTCDCKWGSYGSHKKHCRHVAAGLKLQEMGELRLPIVEDDSEAGSFDLAEVAYCWDAAYAD
jgi:hypothetical protein